MCSFDSIRLVDFVIGISILVILYLLAKMDVEHRERELAYANLLTNIRRQTELNKQMLNKLVNKAED